MEISNGEKAAIIQNSIETGTLAQIGLINPKSYKQHNVNVADGFDAILALHELMRMEKVYTNVIRAFQDGDIGFVHVDYYLFEPTVAFDIHRFENGLSVEHWDNLQTNSKKTNKSGRTMVDGKTKAIDHHLTADNKRLASAFVNEVLVGKKFDKAHEFFNGDILIQHNPDMGDGVAEFFNVLKEWKNEGKEQNYTAVHQVLGEGNFVLVLSEGYKKNVHCAFYDLYRIENNKIIEHWDVIEEIPAVENQKNTNGKF
ncbi:putative SnoaL-like aldol condensation-catalyzing enzyme [Pedobacter cryoconitis]|uniref:Putative SnoaL-like aldol condensation-catalyzing enzyme n=1 Tax=Pedobacter cryoconitis TaxID=188932 RepID=A0A7W9DWS3_9SPHI|nr:hypothetical protein [Pedobacter cryoconitis]MBB5634387.1 putative SnoaL-like aldol condensation-catalyzing enzyme [Pedobacter cryoconitis]